MQQEGIQDLKQLSGIKAVLIMTEENVLVLLQQFLRRHLRKRLIDPLDELRHAGVDLASPAPVHAALEKFEKVLVEAKKLAENL